MTIINLSDFENIIILDDYVTIVIWIYMIIMEFKCLVNEILIKYKFST